MKFLKVFIISFIILLAGCSSNNTQEEQIAENSLVETEIVEEKEETTENTNTDENIESTTTMWQEYIKTDNFGNVINKKTKHDPRFYIELNGYSKESFTVKQFDVVMAIAINDYSLLVNKTGETLKILPVYSVGGTTMMSISETGHIRVLNSEGKRYDFKGDVKRDRFIFTDDEDFFSKHLRKGEDLQAIVYTDDGQYEFHFDIPASNFKDLYDELAEKESK